MTPSHSPDSLGTVQSLYDAEGKVFPSSLILADTHKLETLRNLYDAFGLTLQNNHREVLAQVIGFGVPRRTQTELATQLGLSRARVSAMTGQALRNLVKRAETSNFEPETSTDTGLATYTGDALARAVSWANLSDEALRREAVRAANLRDGEALWTLTEAFVTLYSSKRSKVSGNTLRTYRRGILDLLTVWADENLLAPGRDAGAKYLLKLETTPYKYVEGQPRYYKPETLNARLAAVRTLYRALRWAKATSADPFGAVKPVLDPVPAEEKRPAYTKAEVAALVAVTARGSAYDCIDRAFVLLCAHGGLRASEATTLTWRQVDIGRGGMNVLGKGGKEQWVGFSDDLLKALEVLMEGQPLDTGVLPFGADRARERLKGLCQRAGVEYKGIHSLRHFAGTQLWERYRSLDAPADHLRHSNVQTTRRYAKKTREQRRELARGLKVDPSPASAGLAGVLERLAALDENAQREVLTKLRKGLSPTD